MIPLRPPGEPQHQRDDKDQVQENRQWAGVPLGHREEGNYRFVGTEAEEGQRRLTQKAASATESAKF